MIVPRRLRAPPDEGAILAEPPWTEVASLLRSNRQRLEKANVVILGRSLAEMRIQAREAALNAARQYLQQAGDPIPPISDAPLLLAGHQPELFHPGVWVKNFAMNGLARTHGCIPLNILVDNDTPKSVSLRMPDVSSLIYPPTPSPPPHAPSGQWLQPVSIPFDRWINEVPYEEREVQDPVLFENFVDQARQAMQGWEFPSMLPAFWNEVQRQGKRTRLLGERLARARRAFERSWGCHNSEVPVSRLCGTEPFAWFACHLLADLPRFHAVYNACVNDFRRVYGIRSRSHPVPDLATDGDWLEIPLWGWSAERPRRARLMARPGATSVELRSGTETWPSLPHPGTGNPNRAVTAWQDLERGGFKIRSRALTNTLYARLFVGEVFLHGIGGAKYDELTDEIIRRFYGFEPPQYMILSATLRLPFPLFPAQPRDKEQLARQLRDLHCNPQRYLGPGATADPQALILAAKKQEWIARQPRDGRERRERYQAIQQITAQLRSFVKDRRRQVSQDLERCEWQLQAYALLSRRDYAFCLFPEAMLREFCSRFLSGGQS